MAQIKMGQGLYANYAALTSKDQYTVYFCTDTHQIFVGAEEYTKSTKALAGEPTTSTSGDIGRLYYYNNSLYLCSAVNDGSYTWIRVANVNDMAGSVTSVGAGEGLETDVTGGGAITSTGSISHSVPSGAATVTDDLTDQTGVFGQEFAIKGVSTDKFGHVTAVNTHYVTLPSETDIVLTSHSGGSSTLAPGSTFAAVVNVEKTLSGSHQLASTVETFTLPNDTTYTISSSTEGVITLTGSDTSSSTVQINGWSDLAKKSELASVFRFKGTVTNVSDLPQTAGVLVGDVYCVTNGSGQGTASEYVCTDNTTPGSFHWEELGTTIDLSAYATTAYVDEKMSWQTF